MYTTSVGGVGLQVLPISDRYTWKLLKFTLRVLAQELRARGWYQCMWKVWVPLDTGERLYMALGELYPSLLKLGAVEHGGTEASKTVG